MKIFLHKLLYISLFYFLNPSRVSDLFLKTRKINKNLNKKEEMVSIIIVTYNAINYVVKTIETLRNTNYKNKEIIVIDNNSDEELKNVLKEYKLQGVIDKLHFSKVNTYFSGGNNKGAELSDKKSKYLLFLNSDVEILNENWLSILIQNSPEAGIISYGKVQIPVPRPDGWCFLIDKKTFKKLNGINEYFKMDWGITDLTSKVFRIGLPVKVIVNPNKMIIHFGKKSRNKITKQFNILSNKEVIDLFKNFKIDQYKL